MVLFVAGLISLSTRENLDKNGNFCAIALGVGLLVVDELTRLCITEGAVAGAVAGAAPELDLAASRKLDCIAFDTT